MVYLSDKYIYLIVTISFFWILISSVVMYILGVAMMGTESVELPFKIAGVLYYSRTIFIPMFLLYFLEKSILFGNNRLLKRCIYVLLILAGTEIVVRATKAPLFVLALQLMLLYAILIANYKQLKIAFNKKYVLISIFLAIALWPLVDVYRAAVVQKSGLSFEYLVELSRRLDVSQKNYATLALERFFGRIVGFRQISGLVADGVTESKLYDVLQYGGISKYYTRHHLGYTMKGHLSSPSLLGTCLILGGESGWYFIFTGYVIVMAIIWNSAFYLLPRMAIPTASLLGVEVSNSIMAGTIDTSFERIALIFLMATAMEFIVLIDERMQDAVAIRNS